jgi:hypothetical protein
MTNYSDSEPIFRMMRIPRPRTAQRSARHLAVISSGTDFISAAIERADTVGQQRGYLFHESGGIYGEEVGRFLVRTRIRNEDGLPLLEVRPLVPRNRSRIHARDPAFALNGPRISLLRGATQKQRALPTFPFRLFCR